ncbi:hypothetical protein H8S22_11560 [Anaerostipes sp. NSJ-7]|uniref:Uracil-DNA glycosylase n=1 Tax=Anaerostipes hominis (ex Liu et al. 2021) TaxID=2763018 RepID=A0ABR7FSV1_9FIRM|nr:MULTISPECIES: hypothetical protein [Anaerostipes]MBC5678214.1 hypothetical protein [Anaerostipes hominis (ex Liu et al. 2021)]
MKAALIIDMPEYCHGCKFWFAKATDPVRYRCMAAQKYIENLGSKPNWCPLRELPEKKTEVKERKCEGSTKGTWKVPVPENVGWNACLDEIMKQSLKFC